MSNFAANSKKNLTTTKLSYPAKKPFYSSLSQYSHCRSAFGRCALFCFIISGPSDDEIPCSRARAYTSCEEPGPWLL